MGHITNILKIATNPHHLAHPFSHVAPESIGLKGRILGTALFALSFLSLGIVPVLMLFTAYRKYTGDFTSPAAQKAQSVASIQFNKPLFDAVQNNDLGKLKEEMAVKGRSVNALNDEKTPLLLFAIELKNADIIRFLLEQKDLDLNNTALLGGTALHYAVNSKDLETVNRLLALGANPNSLNHEQLSPLHTAIMEGSLETVRALISSDKVDIHLACKPFSGSTPLMLAIIHKKPFIAADLLEKKKDGIDLNATNLNDQNIFHILALHTLSLDEYMRILDPYCPPEQKAALLRARDYQGKTPYECALGRQEDLFDGAPIPANTLKLLECLKP